MKSKFAGIPKFVKIGLYTTGAVYLALGMLVGVRYLASVDLINLIVQSVPSPAMAQNQSTMDRKVLYWVAPMDPNFRRDKPGKSPMGMDLIPFYDEKTATQSTATAKKEKKILFWVAPMNPAFRSDRPGRSPMGMDLIPVYADEDSSGGGSDPGTVRISPAVINNMGVRTAKVRMAALNRQVQTVGYVEYNETRISKVHLRAKGWIERLHVKSQWERVKKGQLLFEVYSPILANAQDEYLQAMRFARPGLIDATKKRLDSLGFSARQIAALEQNRKADALVPVYARQSGVIVELNVREGAHVMPSRNIMTIADLSSIWVMVDVFEQQASWIKTGQKAEVRLPYLPGKVWRGEVEYVYPSLNPKTRALPVRLRFDNPGKLLKPDMYAEVTIHTAPRENVVIIPREALIQTGNSKRVIMAMDGGRFHPVPVEVGMESGGFLEIRSGLKPGDEVVISAQFLIDSESSIRAGFTRMSEANAGSKQSRTGHASAVNDDMN